MPNEDLDLAPLLSAFEQSWAYVRHAQVVFWQSFAALFTAMTVVALFSVQRFEDEPEIRWVAIVVVGSFAFVGLIVTTRLIMVMREHFIAINNMRRKCGLDDLGVVPSRWQRYKLSDFSIFRAETSYMFAVQQIYVLALSAIGVYAGYALDGKVATASVIIGVIVFLCSEVWGIMLFLRVRDDALFGGAPQNNADRATNGQGESNDNGSP